MMRENDLDIRYTADLNKFFAFLFIVVIVWAIVLGFGAYLEYRMSQECTKINMTYQFHDSRSFYCYRMTTHGIVYQEFIYQSYASGNRSLARQP